MSRTSRSAKPTAKLQMAAQLTSMDGLSVPIAKESQPRKVRKIEPANSGDPYRVDWLASQCGIHLSSEAIQKVEQGLKTQALVRSINILFIDILGEKLIKEIGLHDGDQRITLAIATVKYILGCRAKKAVDVEAALQKLSKGLKAKEKRDARNNAKSLKCEETFDVDSLTSDEEIQANPFLCLFEFPEESMGDLIGQVQLNHTSSSAPKMCTMGKPMPQSVPLPSPDCNSTPEQKAKEKQTPKKACKTSLRQKLKNLEVTPRKRTLSTKENVTQSKRPAILKKKTPKKTKNTKVAEALKVLAGELKEASKDQEKNACDLQVCATCETWEDFMCVDQNSILWSLSDSCSGHFDQADEEKFGFLGDVNDLQALRELFPDLF